MIPFQKILIAAITSLCCTSAFGQSVKQSGTITPGQVPWWISAGVIGGVVTSADSPVTSFGATGPICSNSARTSSGAWVSMCLQANTNSPATLSVQNNGTANPQPFNLVINGVTGTPAFIPGVAPINHIATFGSNILQDSGVVANGGAITSGAWQASPVAILYGGCGSTTVAGCLANLGTGTMALQNANSVAITGGTITGMPTPSVASDVANKAYVDNTSQGLIILAPSNLATTTVLPNTPTYNNGTAGVGATLTAGSNTTLTVDGTVATINQIVLVKNQVTAANNGIYKLTTAGDGSNAWVLTRATYFDTGTTKMKAGSYTLVTGGATLLNTTYVLQTTVVTVGTDAVNFAQFSSTGGGTVTGGGGGLVPTTGSPTTLFTEQHTFGGRISLQSGTCVSKTDQTAKTSVFYAPCGGGKYIPIYDGTNMELHQFTANDTDQVGLTLALGSNWAANTIYDVYLTLVTGTVTPCTVAWSNSGAGTSTQATATTQLKGVLVNSTGPVTCRTTNSATISVAQYQGTWVGMFRTNSSTGQVDLKFGSTTSGGGVACICIWNVYNPQVASVLVGDSSSPWSCTPVGTYAQTNTCSAGPGAGNQVNVLQGPNGNSVHMEVTGVSSNSGGNPQYVGIGIDSTTVNSSPSSRATLFGTNFGPSDSGGDFALAAGYHNIVRLEGTATGGTTTWIGFSGTTFTQTAIKGSVWY